MFELLKEEVMTYLQTNGHTLQRRVIYKTLFVSFLFIVTYVVTLMAYRYHFFYGLLFNIPFIIASLFLVFCIFHDASHQSIVKNRRINYLICLLSGGLFGVSSDLWILQHVKHHHGHTNVPEQDKDIEKGLFFRFYALAKKHKWHNWQHLYALPLYSFIILNWLIDDFICVFNNTYKLSPEKRVSTLLNVIIVKILHIIFFLYIPYLIIHHLASTLTFYFVSIMGLGLGISIIFQLAHLTGTQQFPNKRMNDWALHHLSTTANFSNSNHLLTWSLGALNFQIEHHLFPGLSHQLYPEISPIVKGFCKKNGLIYHQFPSLKGALIAHLGYLKQLGSIH